MEAAPHKAAAVQPPTTYHKNYQKLDEPNIQDTAGEVGMSSKEMYEQRQDNQLEPTYSSSVPKRDVAQRTCQKQWTIG